MKEHTKKILLNKDRSNVEILSKHNNAWQRRKSARSPEIIDAAKLLLEEEIWGLYNLVCGGLTGRFEVAEEVLNFFKLSDEVKLTKVNSEFFKKEYFAPRPDSERLINAKLNIRNFNIMRDWKFCLEDYLSSSFSEYLK